MKNNVNSTLWSNHKLVTYVQVLLQTIKKMQKSLKRYDFIFFFLRGQSSESRNVIGF